MNYTNIQKSITNTLNQNKDVIDKNLFKSSKERTSLSQQDFMQLFLVQLRSQDPTNPMDTSQMANQLAQFNQVDLLYKQNQSMETMVKTIQEQAKAQSLTYIGQSIFFDGNKLNITNGIAKPFEYELEKDAKSLKISIFNDRGKLVYSEEKSAVKAGKYNLDWDLKDINGNTVPDGYYRVLIEAYDVKGDIINVSTKTSDIVTGIKFDKDQLKLLLKNGTEVALDKIEKIFNI